MRLETAILLPRPPRVWGDVCAITADSALFIAPTPGVPATPDLLGCFPREPSFHALPATAEQFWASLQLHPATAPQGPKESRKAKGSGAERIHGYFLIPRPTLGRAPRVPHTYPCPLGGLRREPIKDASLSFLLRGMGAVSSPSAALNDLAGLVCVPWRRTISLRLPDLVARASCAPDSCSPRSCPWSARAPPLSASLRPPHQ